MKIRHLLLLASLALLACGPERTAPDGGSPEDAGPLPMVDGASEDAASSGDGGPDVDGGSSGRCGDGNPDAGEECDDGNADDTDACTNGCRVRCEAGATRGCGSDVGACTAGVETCASGMFGACVGATPPSDEGCNELDDDCDGATDEGCTCTDGASRPCGTDVGACAVGTQSCSGGTWGTCAGSVVPVTEACASGADEDCDGLVDEGCPTPTHEGFESGDLEAFPWETDGPHPWIVAPTEGRGGSAAVRTHPDHAAGETSSLRLTLSVRSAGRIAFWTKLETEDAHFELTFLIDGTEQLTTSGVADWTRHEYAVTPGVHTFEWRYHRDDFISTEHPLRNAVWVDDVELPLYNSQPGVPSGLWPFDDARIAEVRPRMRWASVDPDPGDTVIYELQLASDPTFTGATSSGELTAATFTPSADLASGTHWWRVRAKDDFDDTWGAFTEPHAFTVDPAVIRPSWLQRTGDQLVRGTSRGAVAVVGDGIENLANVLITTAYDDGAGRNFVTVRRSLGSTEDTCYTSHAPFVGFEHHGYSWGGVIQYQYDGGFRFQNVAIPPGAEIESATLCLMQCFNCSGYDVRSASTMTARITADRVADAPMWPNTGAGTALTGYTPTSASVPWTLSAVLPYGTCAAAPDIRAILQEVIDQPGWAAGNDVRFLLEDTHGFAGSGVGAFYNERLFYSQGNELRVTFPAVAVVTSSPIRFADIAGAGRWDKLQWQGSGDVRVRVLDAAGVAIPATVLPGNDTGFTARTIALWGLDPAVYPELRLEATLTRGAAVARLDQWEVSWGTDLVWEFDVEGDDMGWVYGPTSAGSIVNVAGGVLRVDGDGAAPNLRLLGLYVPAADFDRIEVVLRTGNNGIYDVVAASWANETGGFGLHHRESAPVFLLAEQTVTLDLLDASSGMGAWSGTIANLRVAPVEAFEGGANWFEIERIRLLAR